VIAADQGTKAFAVAALSDGHDVHLVGPFSLVLAYNRGVAFSLGSSVGAPLIALAAVVVVVIVAFGRRLPGRLGVASLGLVVGGALSNLGDRLFRPAGVVDFLHSTFWPTFNLADSAIVVGCVLLALALLRERPAGSPAR